jgi:hypothetical protein
MAAKGYTSKEKIERYANITIDGSMDAQILAWVEAAENQIDLITGRNFLADSNATARLFDGDGSSVLIIPDAVEVTLVEVGLDSYGGGFQSIQATGANRYFTLPGNHVAEGVPITRIELNSHYFARGRQNNRITAKWGYSEAVPLEIEFAATVLVTGIINEQRGGGDKIAMEKIGNYSVSYDTNDKNGMADYHNAIKSLDKYKRYYL